MINNIHKLTVLNPKFHDTSYRNNLWRKQLLSFCYKSFFCFPLKLGCVAYSFEFQTKWSSPNDKGVRTRGFGFDSAWSSIDVLSGKKNRISVDLLVISP